MIKFSSQHENHLLPKWSFLLHFVSTLLHFLPLASILTHFHSLFNLFFSVFICFLFCHFIHVLKIPTYSLLPKIQTTKKAVEQVNCFFRIKYLLKGGGKLRESTLWSLCYHDNVSSCYQDNILFITCKLIFFIFYITFLTFFILFPSAIVFSAIVPCSQCHVNNAKLYFFLFQRLNKCRTGSNHNTISFT